MTIPPLMAYAGPIRAVILDWAGTVIDFGSCAPAAVFVGVFRKHGVEVTMAEAREPMGMAKRAHIAAVLAMPAVAARWREQHGQLPQDGDIDRLYQDFQAMQLSVLRDYGSLIPGAAEVAAALRKRGIKIGSSTGYTAEMMCIVADDAKRQGYAPDVMLCSSDMPEGRPAPWLIFENMRRLGVYPPASVVKVDDTVAGVEAGRNAGVWTVGVAATGNLVGLSEAELQGLAEHDRASRIAHASERLTQAGAHFVIEAISDLLRVIDAIEATAATPAH